MNYVLRPIKPEELMENGQASALHVRMCDIYEKATKEERGFSKSSAGARHVYKLANHKQVTGAFDENGEILGFSTCINCTDGNEILGCTDKGFLQGIELAVDPEYQRMGIGKALVKNDINNKLGESYHSHYGYRTHTLPFTFTFNLKKPEIARFYIQDIGVIGLDYRRYYGYEKSSIMMFVIEDELLPRKNSLEDLTDEEIFDASKDLGYAKEIIESKLPDAFSLKFSKNEEIDSFFNFVFNEKLYVLTEVIKDDGEYYYRFQKPERIMDLYPKGATVYDIVQNFHDGQKNIELSAIAEERYGEVMSYNNGCLSYWPHRKNRVNVDSPLYSEEEVQKMEEKLNLILEASNTESTDFRVDK